MAGTKLKIRDFSWEINSSDNRYHPYVELIDHLDNSLKKVQLKSYEFNWILTSDKICPGYGLNDQYYPCIGNNQLNSNTDTMCDSCDRKQGFKDAFFYNREPNKSIKKYLEQKHFLYLAFFPINRIKVGTASNSRKVLRLVEQDSGAFAYIAEVSDAYAARDLEKSISNNTSIPESIGSTSKFKLLSAKVNLDYCQKLLRSAYSEMQASKITSDIIMNPELISTSEIAEIFFPDKKIDLRRDNILSGNSLGLRGRYLILENRDKYFAWDVRTLIGRTIIGYTENHLYDIHEDQQLELI